MRIAYLDCFSGISGDMFLGALVDAGVRFELLQKTVADLNIDASLELARVDRAGISAAKVDVLVRGEKDMPREGFWTAHHQADKEEGQHEHRSQSAESSHGHKHGRHLQEILGIIAAAPISDRAKQTASDIFLALGTAEAIVHNLEVEQIHFHEVGAEDAIVDVVCSAVGAETLGVERFIASPLNVGGGVVKCSHGVMPIPTPATLELLKGAPIYSGDIQKELVTPTGAAIVKVLVSGFQSRPRMTTENIGYGAGVRNFEGQANVLRLSVGEALDAGVSIAKAKSQTVQEEISILEANLDDLNPQLIGYITELALSHGALDVFTMPVQMKKNRPGTLLTVLAKPEDEAKLRELIFRESSTLGIRVRRENRYVLPRRHQPVATPWGEVRMKIGGVNGSVSTYAPEYEDCRRIAAEHHLPLKTVMQEAIRRYLDQKNG
jgi:pyridinium-3,5-bisthiocarboxylic acid mononucleotide nickel chelatase